MEDRIHSPYQKLVLSDREFNFLRQLALEEVGIVLSEFKKDMLYSRLMKRVRALGLHSFEDYCEFLKKSLDQERGYFINAITTNHTSFFRENHHFEFLQNAAIRELKKRSSVGQPVRIWSAGCSTGEEPYSIAMTLLNAGLTAASELKILATDVDTNVLGHGQRGVYKFGDDSGVNQNNRNKWFQPVDSDQSDEFVATQRVKELISFKRLNLLERWPMKMQYSIIFCRNVVIYFDRDTQADLFNRYADKLVEGGYLIIGHSESLVGVDGRFEQAGSTIYRKIK